MCMHGQLVGRSLRHGEYALRSVLGQGRHGTVFRAYARSLRSDVAVKVLGPRLTAQSDVRARFHDEACRLVDLQHPNLVEVHFFGEQDDLLYVAMRLMADGTLKERLEQTGGKLDPPVALRLVSQIGAALQSAHDAGLLHLDVRPAKVLLDGAGRAALTDMGMARVLARRRTDAEPAAYRAPELCRGALPGPAADQYSLAVLAHELLTAQPPSACAPQPDLPDAIADVLATALRKAPGDRYASVAAFAEALLALTPMFSPPGADGSDH